MKESAVIRQILDYLAAEHKLAFRLGTGRFFFEGRAFKAHSLGPGAADICVPAEGTVWIECKTERGQQTLAQKGFEAWVTDRGHHYIVAHSVEDLEGVL